MKTILVTGTAGFIGFSLARQLLADGHSVIGVDVVNPYYPVEVKRQRLDILAGFERFSAVEEDLCDLSAMEKAFAEHSPQIVVNLAAQAGVRHSITHPHDYQRSNLQGFLNILECSRHGNVERLVYASSSSVYGGNTKLPFSVEDPVDRPISLYAATKRANELMAHSYSHLYDMQTVGLRFFTVYGPWGRPDMAMWIFAEKILDGVPIPVFNHGKMKRDFTYIDDIVAGIQGAMFSDGLEQFELFNLGNHRMEVLMDMIHFIEDGIGKKAELNLLPMQPGDVPASFADIDISQAKLNFTPSTSLADGVAAFCQWYLEHPDLAEAARNWRNG
jgi:UDP-glucuronate 4-epimerase